MSISALFNTSRRTSNAHEWSAYPPILSIIAHMRIQRLSAISGPSAPQQTPCAYWAAFSISTTCGTRIIKVEPRPGSLSTLQLHSPGFDLGEVEDIVDQRKEMPAGA